MNARRTRRTEPSSGRRRRKTERTPANANANHRSHRITGGVFETLAQPCVNEQPTINRLFPPRPVPSTPTSTRRRRRAPHTPTRTAPALAHRTSCPHHRTLSRTHHRNHRNHRPRPRRRRRRRVVARAPRRRRAPTRRLRRVRGGRRRDAVFRKSKSGEISRSMAIETRDRTSGASANERPNDRYDWLASPSRETRPVDGTRETRRLTLLSGHSIRASRTSSPRNARRARLRRSWTRAS